MNGLRIIRFNILGTLIFSVSALWAAIVFDGLAKSQGVVVALVLFAIGTGVFLWGYWTAVQRSRQEEISVAELYFLMGSVIPRSVKIAMHSCLATQVLVALATALSRPNSPSSDGLSSNPGSTLAFGVLVPVLGLGLNGLWAASPGKFAPRRLKNGTEAAVCHPDTDPIG